MNAAINIHPADELAAIREEIKMLQERESELRAALLQPDADMNGRQYTAFVTSSNRETVDKGALIADLGRAAVAPYLKTTVVSTLKLAPVQAKE